VVVVNPSPVASVHDRACECFYQLVGGNVQFGEEHSRLHDHSQDGGGNHTAKLPAWCGDTPVHLIGHSLGGQTMRMLEAMVSKGQFATHKTDSSWIASVTCLNAPLNGSLLVHSLGALSCPEAVPGSVRWGSFGFTLGFLLHLLELLCPLWLKALTFDPQLAQWCLGNDYQEVWRALCGRSRIFNGTDNAAYSMTPGAALQHNTSVMATQDNVFYISLYGT
ncbi:unnamed protein product, partial [Chrysoparadoxa australica]